MKAKLILISGFLGAGRSTLIDQLAKSLTKRRDRIAFVANDDLGAIVDTTLGNRRTKIPNSALKKWLCSSRQDLPATMKRLKLPVRPNIIVSRTLGHEAADINSTIKKLTQALRLRLAPGPLCAVIDPRNASLLAGLHPGRALAPVVDKFLRSQMNMAQIIVINKVDILFKGEQQSLEEALAKAYPKAAIVPISARTGKGCKKLFELLLPEN